MRSDDDEVNIMTPGVPVQFFGRVSVEHCGNDPVFIYTARIQVFFGVRDDILSLNEEDVVMFSHDESTG